MKLAEVVEWEESVFPCWQKAATNSSHTNSDIWSRLPPGVCWLAGEIEEQDLAQLRVVGSQDWCDTFGSYQLQHISQIYQASQAQQQAGGDPPTDPCHHHARIKNLCHSLQQNPRDTAALILVAANVQGPKVLLDGNHRAIALLQLQRLVGQRCYLGLHSRMEEDFLWMRRALRA